MDIAELRQKQTDAINVLRRFGTIDALQWLMDCNVSQNPNFKIEMSGQWSGMEITRHLSFQSGENTYDLYLLNETTVTGFDSVWTKGDFHFYFDSSLVLETEYRKSFDDHTAEWGKRTLSWGISEEIRLPSGEMISLPGDVKTIKLTDWVETLPKIVEKQKQLIEDQSEKDRREANRKEVSETKDNFDLGKYQ